MWGYEYNEDSNETTIYWDGTEQATIDGQINRWQNGYPATPEAREAVAEAIQDAGDTERIRMQYDFNYGFAERE